MASGRIARGAPLHVVDAILTASIKPARLALMKNNIPARACLREGVCRLPHRRPKAQDFRRELARVAAELGDHFVARPRRAVQSRPAQPLEDRRVRLYGVSGKARAGALFNIVKLTKALYYKHFADQFVYSLPPGFDCCVHRLYTPQKRLAIRSPERCIYGQNPTTWTGSSR
jgi:hypothetical protein